MAIQYIFTDLGDLSGHKKEFTRCREDEKQLEFFTGTVKNSEMHRCAIDKSADQSVSATTWTAITFDQEKYDVGGMHDNVTNNTRLTIKEAGDYRIIYHIKHDAMDKTSYESRVKKNGSTVLDGLCDVSVGSKDSSYMTLSSTSYLITFAVNDYVELEFYHDDGATQDILSSNTFFSIEREL